MKPTVNVGKGEVKEYNLIDTRGVAWSPFNLPKNMPMANPFTWELFGEWEDGFHLNNQALIRVEKNVVIEAYTLTPLNKDKGDSLGSPFKL